MKKYIYWDLFHLSLVVSLLRLYPNLYRGVTWDAEPFGHEVYLGDSTAYTQARFHNLHNNRLNAFIHPKNIDDAIERSLFIHDVNSLCRRPVWNFNPQRRETNIFAYIVNELQPHSVASTAQENQESETSESQTEVTAAAELTQADMDLIEVLWKQDIDMGIAREVYDGTWKPKDAPAKVEEEPFMSPSSSSYNNPWQGLNYSIDSETGEHIALPTISSSNNAAALVPNNYLDITLEEALSLFEADNLNDTSKPNNTLPENFNDPKPSDVNLFTTEDFLLDTELTYTSSAAQNRTLLEQLQDLQEMVSEAHVEPFPESFSPVGSEYAEMTSSYNSTENNNAILDVLLQNTTLALPLNETLLNVSYPSSSDGFTMEHNTNINTLLSFLTNDTDPNPVGAVGGEDQIDLCPDLPIANLTVDNSFLNQLMNEGSMDFSDFCDLPINTTQPSDWPASTSSDSAVSSMGSDWSDSCSGESSNCGTSVWNPKKTNFGFKSEEFSSFKSEPEDAQKPMPPSLKRYQSFGKQQDIKKSETILQLPEKTKPVSFPASPDEEYETPTQTEPGGDLPHLAFIHNHTYHYVGDAVPDKEASQKPLERDKAKASSTGSVRGTRDEKRLRNTNLPLTVKEIVDLPIERFNERLAQLDLAEEHVSLIRDIRRRGKNKLAARTCRKRKVDQISELQGILDGLDHKREVAQADLEESIFRRDLLKQKYQRLYRFIFPDRDPPEPVPSTAYYEDDSVVPPSRFPLCASTTSRNETEHKKRGKHKSTDDK